jgi:hypothetical protein
MDDAATVELIYECTRRGIVEYADAGRMLEALRRALATPPPPVVEADPREHPFTGANWSHNRRLAYSIGAAASGCRAILPARPAPPIVPRRHHSENPPAHRKRLKSGGTR